LKLYLHVDYDNDVFYLGFIDVGGQYQLPVSSGSCDSGPRSTNSLPWLIVLTILLAFVVAAVVVLAWSVFHRQRAQLKALRADVARTRDEIGPLLERPSTGHGSERSGQMPNMD